VHQAAADRQERFDAARKGKMAGKDFTAQTFQAIRNT